MKGLEVEDERPFLMALHDYYYKSLNKAIQCTIRLPEESDTSFKDRVRNAYFSNRQNAYSYLFSKVKDIYEMVYRITGVRPEDVTKVRKDLIGRKTLFVKVLDYEG